MFDSSPGYSSELQQLYTSVMWQARTLGSTQSGV